MTNSQDIAVGGSLIAFSTFVFTYYTFWALVLPFIDEDSFLQNFFLPRPYVIGIPVFLLVLGLTLICLFFGSVLMKKKNKKKSN
ncbi:dolichol phosphate-mannose biosynthesis regulatory [Conidiobolus coronatus NRRL 28638]|uniref:Dolichol phosphate-mannose biosynthesis regulatory protein n=1 Tax=Conidiobolus coronatus (strain ATCC 28846 / CBS 209.66 / NRRL 28638) TaxID=796925 RepID=A0A137PGQ9_CONC2|nr:dolichol phosphate-mannose biosynthesis regulatory [Conidiobolus coronatus NRRL 28638]|eukprot:KXN74187.1 dolichol phosphate-mannose biosynthesis regulatory [Conidiobolus coronatus NRRL 28638]